jgi:hypothetical protein
MRASLGLLTQTAPTHRSEHAVLVWQGEYAILDALTRCQPVLQACPVGAGT